MKLKATTINRTNAMRENAAHSQSEPWVEMWIAALGGLRSKAWFAMSARTGGAELREV